MKKLIASVLCLASLAAYADEPQFNNLSKSDLEKVSNEFAMNFSHTAVAAPETDGIWGVEVGLVAGQTQTPELKDVVESSGGPGSDFDQIYHAGAMARVHIPGDVFFEVTLLPEREISGIEVSSRSASVGWDFGRFFGLPLDLAVGANASKSELSFDQTVDIMGIATPNTVDIDSTTRVLWVGVSKTFLFITPYAKVGTARSESDVKATAQIFQFTNEQKEQVESSGSFFAVGANLTLGVFNFGAELSQQADVKRASAKLSLAF